MPKIIIEFSIERKYPNPHLNLKLDKISPNNLCSGSTGKRAII
jgi:hypothetical protein